MSDAPLMGMARRLCGQGVVRVTLRDDVWQGLIREMWEDYERSKRPMPVIDLRTDALSLYGIKVQPRWARA